ncbi:DsbA family protein [Pectinatus brassicae]|uniref:Putative DsbA family dithiol-disulfide isomerase n=1 Tax=Pectinatus brassicae TaxID=862415 RepID=A0A840UKU3_9FIRM|nr:DsbA family protein [Pectinatus brassicae]MBB5336327.1 putative DsbA family dithiol-disulfide isomerase [Pectinatus brassicae]
MAELYGLETQSDINKLEVFFDYTCPYCYRGHKNLIELLADNSMEIIWRPCEAHPWPEEHGTHSDLAIAGMYFIEENDGNLVKYHQLVFAANFAEQKNIADINVLSAIAEQCDVDKNAFKKALQAGKYKELVIAGNKYAWQEKAFSAVPSYARGCHTIGSDNGIMVTRQELAEFMVKDL